MISWRNIIPAHYPQVKLCGVWISDIIIVTQAFPPVIMQPVSLTYRFSKKNIIRCWQTEYTKLQLFVFTEQLRRLKATGSEKDITALLQWKKRPKSSSECLRSLQAKSFGGAYGGHSFIQHKTSILNQLVNHQIRLL